MTNTITTKLFPVWVIIAALAAMIIPEAFTGLKSWIVPLLMLVMLGMGLTLKPKDFFELHAYKAAVAAGVILQFSIMPLIALFIANVFQLSTELTVGLVLVGSVAGGTASNVITLLARGNVALSVSMTAISTFASVLMTPLLMEWLVGSQVHVPATTMIMSLFKIILLPVLGGIILNVYCESWVNKISGLLPSISVAIITLIIAIVVALNATRLKEVAALVFIATLLHNVSGMMLGYLAAVLLRFDKKVCRTIAIEVGMQNSGLATALALKFFGPIAALPGAIFSIWLNITGSLFASGCTRHESKKASRPETNAV